MKITTVHEAKTQLSSLIESVLQGEEVIISKAGKPVVRLVPYALNPEPRKPGYWAGKVKIAEDFDDTPEDVISSFLGE